jgi:hypothetical protein
MNNDKTSNNGVLPLSEEEMEARLERAGASWRRMALPMEVVVQQVARISAQGRSKQRQNTRAEDVMSPSPSPSSISPSRALPRRTDVWVISVIATLLVIASVVLFPMLHAHSVRTMPMAHQTPTTTPLTNLLTWQMPPLAPWQKLPSDAHSSYAIDQSDADIIYACAQLAGATMVQTWVTRDRGRSWQSLAEIPSTSNGSCGISIDQMNPLTVIISTSVIKVEPIPTPIAEYLSTDGGQHWKTIAAPANIGSLASTPAAIFALIVNDPPDYGPYVAVSHDHFQTWEKILVANQSLTRFYLSNSGKLLAVMASDPDHLWFSDDLAKTWHQQALTHAPEAIDLAIVRSVDQGWQICGGDACSWDSGRTWEMIPLPPSALLPPAIPTDTVTYAVSVLGIIPDGSVLAEVQQILPPKSGVNTHGYLYRYVPSTQHWQFLSIPPPNVVYYYPSPGHGLLWSLALGGTNSQNASQQNYVAAIP